MLEINVIALLKLSKTNIFLISESKHDASFPYQFKINGYKCLRCDHNKYSGILMFYVSECIPCKVLTNHAASPNIELHQMKCK